LNSRHLTGHVVDLVALDGEGQLAQWEDYFRVAAAVQSAAHELEVPVCWAAAGTRSCNCAPRRQRLDYAAGQKPFLDGPQFEGLAA
jgi:peptidoglycan LD-endopeptidase CwlK